MRRWRFRDVALALAAGSALACSAQAGDDLAPAIALARQWALRMGAPFDAPTARAHRLAGEGRSIRVLSKDRYYAIDADMTYVRRYVDLKADEALQRRTSCAGTMFANESLVWQEVERRIPTTIAGVKFSRYRIRNEYARVDRPMRDRQSIQARFEARAFGRSTQGVGNHIEVILDAETGKVVSFVAECGYTYSEPELRVSADQAKAAAVAVLRRQGMQASVGQCTLKQQWLVPNEQWGSIRGRELASGKRIVNGYAV